MPSTVTNLNDGGPGSLRAAIITTPDGGTVDFQPGLAGTITLVANSDDLVIKKSLTILGPGANAITVSGNHLSRVFDILSATVALSGLTITNGFAGHEQDGGAIYNDSILTLMDCKISNSFPDVHGSAGGILNTGSLTLIASTVSGNNGDEFGGGISNGGILTVIDSTIMSNSARSAGGIGNYGTLVIIGSTINDNAVGGIENFDGTVAILESTLTGNYGGAIESEKGTVAILESTISGNHDGGINNEKGTVTIRNALVAGSASGLDVEGPLTSLGHNLIGDGSGGSGYAATDLIGSSVNPIDPKLGSLQDNGGPTETMALLSGSPAIAAGGPSDSEWDQRGPGYPRSIDGTTDIGAYEVQPGAGTDTPARRPFLPAEAVLGEQMIGRQLFTAVFAPSRSSAPNVRVKPAVSVVDGLFASWTSEKTSLIIGRFGRSSPEEAGLWSLDFVPV